MQISLGLQVTRVGRNSWSRLQACRPMTIASSGWPWRRLPCSPAFFCFVVPKTPIPTGSAGRTPRPISMVRAKAPWPAGLVSNEQQVIALQALSPELKPGYGFVVSHDDRWIDLLLHGASPYRIRTYSRLGLQAFRTADRLIGLKVLAIIGTWPWR